MRYSKSRQSGKAKKLRIYAGVLAIAVIAAYGAYERGIFGAEATEADAAPLTEEQRVAALAECLTASGARLYGASWCPHCQNQKAAFGEASGSIVYVECADETSGTGQSAACAEAEITNYPTWIFGDGTRVTGQRQFWELARKSGCGWDD